MTRLGHAGYCVVVIVLAPGCTGTVSGEGMRCDLGEDCPDGLTCRAGYCRVDEDGSIDDDDAGARARDGAVPRTDAGRVDPGDAGGPGIDAGPTVRTDAGPGGCVPSRGAGATTTALDAEEQSFLVMLNEYRAMNSAGPLTACTSLNRSAQGHSEDMRDNDYFDHDSLDGPTPVQRACAACYEIACRPFPQMGENIAAGNSGAAATFTQWRNSAGHNANMLNDNYNRIGIGRATGGGTYGSYWTTQFAALSEPSCD